VFASREKALESYCGVAELNMPNQTRDRDGGIGHLFAQRFMVRKIGASHEI
jgi:hypothetical protein